MITRRTFITTVGVGPLAAPLATKAQPAGKVPRVGVLWHAGSPEEEAIYLGALRQGLHSLGYVEGRNIALENRFAAEQY